MLLAVALLVAACDEPKAVEDAAPPAVIIVGDQEITLVEFKEALRRLLPEGASEFGPEDLVNLKRSLVKQLVEESLVLREARRRGLGVSDEEVLVEVEALKKGYMGEEFTEAITARYGSVERWKDEIRRKLLIRKVIDGIISTSVEVTEEEARAYYEEHIDEYRVPEQVRARMIVVADEKEAKAVRKRLRREKFEDVAREVSIGPEAEKGGDLGFFSRGEMPEEFEKVVFKLRKGRISRIVKTPYGYHIFRVEERKKGRKLRFEDVVDRIVEKIEREKADRAFIEWMAAAKKAARIEVREELL
ncbi:MAG TPA: hypothetical protein ENJ37_00630 [Deltaproteobacteria bacterium]|nr:hypothetical protein [Deltaproteobacteria bacterium]